ncbi:MAG: hypothetical protein SFT81_05965 [Candidatus Caenarcaniphilales bacterium]|nr:hypothetical protein [Candidatus Caenarcaniphilales bacterium]
MPNADITHKGESTLTFESQIKTQKAGSDNFAFYTYGVGYDTELALSAYNVSIPRTSDLVIAPGFKTSKQLFKKTFPEREIKFTFGTMVPVSLQGEGVGVFTYGHMSYRIPKLNTRLTAGVNYGTKQLFGREQVSAIAAIEQPITKKLTLVIDWFSGKHNFAALAAGLQYNFNEKTAIVVAYKIPNDFRSQG